MATTITRRDYTGRNFVRFQAKLEEYLKVQFPKATNDLYEDHILKVITELTSYAGDQLAFYLDMAFNEVMWDKVGSRRNIVALAKLLGYTPRGIASARVVLDCTTDTYAGNLAISKGTKIPTSVSGVVFEVAQDYIFTSPLVTFQINGIEGTTRLDTFYADGLTGQNYASIFSQVTSSVAPVVKVDGVTWTKVPFLFDVLAGNYYSIEYLDDSVNQQDGQKFRIFFGDGVHGNIPPDSVPITFEYMTSKGALGNVAIGKINATISGLVGITPHDVVVVNNENASGGAPEETVEEIRVNAPIFFQSLGVVTTGKDLRGFIEAYAGVLKAQVKVDSSTKIVLAWVVAAGYQTPSQALLDALQADIEQILVMGAILGLRKATFPRVNATARIYLKLNYPVNEVTDRVTSGVSEFFTPADAASSTRTIGSKVYKSDFIALLDNTEGVEYIELDMLTLSPDPTYIIWAPTSGTFTAMSVGPGSQDETWTVTFTSPTAFEVLGTVSGTQVATGTVGTPYVTDAGGLAFTIAAGANPNQAGDYATIRTTKYVESVTLLDGEYALQGTMNFTFNYAS